MIQIWFQSDVLPPTWQWECLYFSECGDAGENVEVSSLLQQYHVHCNKGASAWYIFLHLDGWFFRAGNWWDFQRLLKTFSSEVCQASKTWSGNYNTRKISRNNPYLLLWNKQENLWKFALRSRKQFVLYMNLCWYYKRNSQFWLWNLRKCMILFLLTFHFTYPNHRSCIKTSLSNILIQFNWRSLQ